MAKYLVGPSVWNGHQPGSTVEHDFSETGPEGEHGPAREAALIAAGALAPVAAERPTRRPALDTKGSE